MKPSLSVTLAVTACAVIGAAVNAPTEPVPAQGARHDRAAEKSPHGTFGERVQPKLDGIGRMRDLPPVAQPDSSAVTARR